MQTAERRQSRQVMVGRIAIGGGAPVVVQSMTNTDTVDVEATTRQVAELARAGSERELEGEAPIQLIIGNAQHVRLSYDDRPVDLAPHVKVEVARLTLE